MTVYDNAVVLKKGLQNRMRRTVANGKPGEWSDTLTKLREQGRWLAEIIRKAEEA